MNDLPPPPPYPDAPPRESFRILWGLAAIVLCPTFALVGLLTSEFVPIDRWILAPIGGGSPGRPFRILGRPVGARDRKTDGWGEELTAFAELSLELLALGAPAELFARCHHAALDEVAHARACFALASAYAGVPRGPGALPIATTRVSPTFQSVAVASAVDGCLNEGCAARNARAQLAGETDPVVRAVLDRIAEDEERHAALGADIVRDCMREGGAGAAAAVARRLGSKAGT